MVAGLLAVVCAMALDYLIMTLHVHSADPAPQSLRAVPAAEADAGDGSGSVPSTSSSDLQQAIDSGTRTSLLAGTAVVLLLGLAVGVPLSRRMSRRLGRLEAASTAMAEGDLRQQLDVASQDEIDKLNHAFNAMSASVATRVELLTDRLGTLSLAIARLNVLGDTLAQSRDVTDALQDVAELVREAFGADAAMLSLVHTSDAAAPRAHGGPAIAPALSGTAHRSGNAGREAFSGSRRLAVALRRLGTAALREHGIQVVEDDPADRAEPAHGATAVHMAGDLAGAAPAAEQAAGDLCVATCPATVHVRMAAPMEIEGSILGFLAVGGIPGGGFGEENAALLTTIAGQLGIALRSAAIVRRLETTNLEMVQALATAMEAKDQYTATHAENIATMAVAVGHHMGLDDGQLRELEYAAVLHDVGKIGVPGHILNKPDRLTALEYTRMTQHTTIGERIVSRVDYLKPVARIVRAAHERWDGSGYPDGLAGEEIPLLSRILFVCDAYDAMTSDRRYRAAMPHEEARAELLGGSGTQFDPVVVEAFLTLIEQRSWTSAAARQSGARTA
jgi:HD-GYP domain-containing protein (c-di-GMP phosphodiesterase class II)/HAMP domain-containing protein